MPSAFWLLVGIFSGAIITAFGSLLSYSMTTNTLKLLSQQEPEFIFEPEETTTTTIEHQDIRIGLSEDEEED